jgi:hypothetical protein
MVFPQPDATTTDGFSFGRKGNINPYCLTFYIPDNNAWYTDRHRERERERRRALLIYLFNDVRERECLQLCPAFCLSLSGIVVVVAVCSTAFCSRGVTTTMLAELLQQNEELPTLKRDPSFIVLC